jgi:hypothetical protein
MAGWHVWDVICFAFTTVGYQDTVDVDMSMNHRYYCQLSALPGNDALVCQRRTTNPGRILGREAVRCRLVCGTCRLIFCHDWCYEHHLQSCDGARQEDSAEDLERIVQMRHEQLKGATVSSCEQLPFDETIPQELDQHDRLSPWRLVSPVLSPCCLVYQGSMVVMHQLNAAPTLW